MPRKPNKYPLLVKPLTGEGLERFFVTSGTRLGHRHLVDLCAYYGNGWCNCEHFQGHIESKLKDIAKSNRPWNDDFRCKHIKAAREYLGRELVDRYLETRRNQIPRKGQEQ